MNASLQNEHRVGVVQIKDSRYPKEAPYHPSVNYPEYPFPGYISAEVNYVYDGIRHLFFKLGFDIERWNTPEWNPLAWLIKPGMAVVIKPNFVISKHLENKDIFSIITHPSVLRAILDYCWIALKGKGKITIVDAPQFNCNFKDLLEVTKLEQVKDFINNFSGSKLEIYDLRNYAFNKINCPFCITKLSGDPQGSILVNLSKNSAFYNHANPHKLCSYMHNRKETINNHFGKKHVYEMSRTIFNADVIISVPKMKIHKKAGVSLNLKGLVGMCTNKNLIIHYTLGTPSEGGDQFPEGLFNKKERALIKFNQIVFNCFLLRCSVRHGLMHRFIYGFLHKRIIKHLGLRVPGEKMLFSAGDWYGNDSVWRTVVDLVKIMYFVDKEGRLHNKPQRQMFSIVDGIIGGENKGPHLPDPKPAGVLIGGENLLAVDIVTTRLMGFDPLKLKQFSILNDPYYDFDLKTLDEIEIIADDPAIQRCLEDKINRFFAFKPYPGWIGYIEV